jgi:excinuclease ABC subunit A
MATGTPEEVAGIEDSYTGQFLRDLLEPAPKPKRTRGRSREPVAA